MLTENYSVIDLIVIFNMFPQEVETNMNDLYP